jgi:hypothetical protein
VIGYPLFVCLFVCTWCTSGIKSKMQDPVTLLVTEGELVAITFFFSRKCVMSKGWPNWLESIQKCQSYGNSTIKVQRTLLIAGAWKEGQKRIKFRYVSSHEANKRNLVRFKLLLSNIYPSDPFTMNLITEWFRKHSAAFVESCDFEKCIYI